MNELVITKCRCSICLNGTITCMCADNISNNNKKFRSFKSIENIHKKEVGPYHGFGYYSLISDPVHLAKAPEENTVNLQVLIMAVVSKTDLSRKVPKYYTFVKKINLNV